MTEMIYSCSINDRYVPFIMPCQWMVGIASFRYRMWILNSDDFIKGKIQFTPSNFHQSPDFNLELQNQITLALQLLKPFNVQPSGRFCGWTVTFDIFGRVWNFILFFRASYCPQIKNSKLQSCRSHRGLQFTYKNYLYPISYWRVFYFLKFESHHATKYGAEILYYFFEHLTVLK